MLYAQVPPHLVVKAPRNEPVEPPKPVPLVDDNVVRHANKQIDDLLELEEHYRRQSAEDLLCFNPRCMSISMNMHGWGENITDVRLRW